MSWLARLQRRFSANPLRDAPLQLGGSRWVVVDVETSGLNTKTDRLLAIAGIALDITPCTQGKPPTIVPQDSFEVVVQQSVVSSKDNILLHGIGAAAQQSGVPLQSAMTQFETWRGGAPLVAFHAWFDQAMLGKSLHTLGQCYQNAHWLDIQPLALTTLFKAQQSRVNDAQKRQAQSLDFWLDRLSIPCHPRHNAMVDAYAEAQLLLQLWRDITHSSESALSDDPSKRAQLLWQDLQAQAHSVRWL